MRSSTRIASIYLSAALVSVLGVGCAEESEEAVQVEAVPPALQRYATPPPPGTLIEFPPVPLLRFPKGLVPNYNGLANPGFEEGEDYWNVSDGNSSVCSTTDRLSADGRFCYQVLPSARGEVFVSQTLPLEPRTFYSFSALLFIPEASEAALEVRDLAGNTLLRGEAVSGPMSQWSYQSLTFITANPTGQITVGVHCSSADESSPILIDGCAVGVFPPAENLLGNEKPGKEQSPNWYVSGKAISPTSEGFHSGQDLELPSGMNHRSRIVGLIPVRPELDGQTVWVSAMTKRIAEGGAPPPQVGFRLRLTNSEGLRSEILGATPPMGDWVETTFTATFPNLFGESATPPISFHALFIERRAGSKGRVQIEDVVMLKIPEGRFDGGLPPSLAP